jgi:hypothetical protein
MPASRLPRFKRTSSVSPLQLTRRDQKIIHLVYRKRFLRSSHIVTMVTSANSGLARGLALLHLPAAPLQGGLKTRPVLRLALRPVTDRRLLLGQI